MADDDTNNSSKTVHGLTVGDPVPLAALTVTAPTSPSDRLRAFEDKVFGENCPRINDKIERGVGSRFSTLDDNHKAHHAALEAMVAAEADHAVAAAALSAAEEKLAAAQMRADQTGEAL